MSQRPKNMVDMETIQIKLGDLAALYELYKNPNFKTDPHILDQTFSPHELKMLQYVDSEPKLQQKLQQLFEEYKSQQDAIKQMEAAQPRMRWDGTISTNQYTERQAAQDFLKGLNNATSGIPGAFGQIYGQYLFPDDPERANSVGELFKSAGDLLLDHADAKGGLRKGFKEYIPNPTNKDLYSKEGHRYSENQSTDPKRFTSPHEESIPGAFPYNNHETEVIGEHTNAPRQPTEAKPSDTGAPKEGVQQEGGRLNDGSQLHDANPPMGVPDDGKQPSEAKPPDMGVPKESVQQEGGHNIAPANQEPNFSSPDGREIFVPINRETSLFSPDTRQVPTSVEGRQHSTSTEVKQSHQSPEALQSIQPPEGKQSLAPPEGSKNFTPADGKQSTQPPELNQSIAPERKQSLVPSEGSKNYTPADADGYDKGNSDADGYDKGNSDAGGSDAGGEVPRGKG